MPFPEVRRVIYAKNPLAQVICQLRFPPILKIDSEVPAAFQERIRQEFPSYAESRELELKTPQAMIATIAPEVLGRMLQDSGSKNYEFLSEDGAWKINLTRTFLALTANNYERWEQFEEKLKEPFRSLIDIYSPSYFTRVGLRYIDVIRRSTLGLEDVPWTDLLKEHVLGVLGAGDVGPYVIDFESKYEIRLPDGESIARMTMGLVEDEDTGEEYYKIDTDFFNSTKIESDVVLEKLDFLRLRGSRLFQWCITERLHEAMEPIEL